MTDALQTTLIQSETVAPSRYLHVLHGIYGRGRNWTTVARDLVGLRPEWAQVFSALEVWGLLTPPAVQTVLRMLAAAATLGC